MKHRVDVNQKEIVDCMRSMGARVAITSMVGNGYPDLTIGYKGEVILVEVKDGKKCASQRKLTKKEEEFHDLWKGYVYIVTSVDDAINLLQSKTHKQSSYCTN